MVVLITDKPTDTHTCMLAEDLWNIFVRKESFKSNKIGDVNYL